MSPPQRGNARGRGRWTSFSYRRTSSVDRRSKPISVPVPNADNHSDASSSRYVPGNDQSQPYVARHIGVIGIEQYPGWNIYFPEESMFDLFLFI